MSMQHELNELGQPVGLPVADWSPPAWPSTEAMHGRYCRLESLDVDRHSQSLYEAHRLDRDASSWTYMPYGPFSSLDEFRKYVSTYSGKSDPQFYAIIDASQDRAIGVASYLRITPAAGTIEVGHLSFSPLLRRTRMATEAMMLMMANAFDLGYRRYEWKCNALNDASRRAALRLGFTFEGIFRQATVVKGRNRDTAWYSILDSEWPLRRAAFDRWLAPENFDAQGHQIRPL